MNTQHTPGPWDLNGQNIVHRGNIAIATVCGEANARLIAAAPDLLSAAEDALESLSRLPDADNAWRITCITQLKSAIAKARQP